MRPNGFTEHRRSVFASVLMTTLLTIATFIAAGSVQAGVILPGQYYLLDHPDGAISPPPYGLRLDDIGATLSTELNGASVILDWNGGTTASITGTLWHNQLGEMWTVDYTLTGVVAAGGNQGFSATGGTGTLTDALLNDIIMTGKQDVSGSAFDFLADGDRLGGFPAFPSDTPVGRGWLEPGGSTNDWLVIGVPVPEPGTALLVGMGLALMAGRRTRRA